MRSSLHFNVNGRDVSIDQPDPETSLAAYIRNTLGLTGTKLACGEGACGSCTVVIGKWNSTTKKARYRAVNACLFPIYLVDGCFVITVEGIGSPDRIHVIQDRLARGHGTQCGFCSPGFVMSAYALLRETPNPTLKQIDQAVKGNLCRCTGYRPILEALYSFSDEGCCQNKAGKGCPCKDEEINKLITFEDFPKLDEKQELIFPPSLLNNHKTPESMEIPGPRVHLLMPINLEELTRIQQQNPETRIVTTGMITRLASARKPSLKEKWVSTARVAELARVEVHDSVLHVGSALTIADLLEAVRHNCDVSVVKPFEKLFDQYSSMQTMNIASWAGSICQRNRSSDLGTLAVALNISVVLLESGEEKTITAAEFYSRTISDHFIVKQIRVPISIRGTAWSFKAGHRPGPESTVVNGAAVVEESEVIDHVRIAFGLGKIPLRASKLETTLRGRPSSSLLDNLSQLYLALDEDLSPHKSLPDFSFRRDLARAGVFQLVCKLNGNADEEKPRGITSTQIFKKTPASQPEGDGVGRPLEYIFADRTTTGEAVFIGDMPAKNLVHLAYVLSTEASADILAIDTSKALCMEGVLGFYDVNNITKNEDHESRNPPGLNTVFNPMIDYTPIFANKIVEACGQPIGAIAASSVEVARRAAAAVAVEYRRTTPILTIEDAMEKKSYLAPPQMFGADEEAVEEKLSQAQKMLEGEIRIGGQEHMYMEPQSALVIPGEGDEFTIYSSTQAINEVQLKTAAVLGIEANKVVVRTKRVGGAFGGKISWSLLPAASAAIVARKLGKPVSAILSREEDCKITGKRHPEYIKYRVGFDDSGRIKALHLRCFFDGGYSVDHTQSVTWVSCAMSDGHVYNIEAMRTEGYAMKTNKNSNTAFRGYGQPQAAFVLECITNRVAFELKKPLEQIREMNFIPSGGKTLIGRTLRNEAMLECWNELKQFADFAKKKDDVEKFNSSSKYVKRGVSISSVRFSLTHGGSTEQAAALVQVYLDGSVAVSIGGTEMGQGLVAKCQQVASRALGVPMGRINMLDAGTDKTANITETAGSQSTDLHGRAVMAACERILTGVQPLLDGGKKWDDAVLEAWKMKLPLQATEVIRFDRAKYGYEEDSPTYFTSGAACVEAEVNCMTGDHKLLSVDIVMDVGESLNPAIDIGQIEGGFMQGYGLLTCEELKWDQSGMLETSNMTSYKIPTAAMTPKQFRVKLLGDTPSYPGQVYSSKGIGEPPLMLGGAAYSAIRFAVLDYRKETGRDHWVQIDAPLTKRQILELCHDN